MVFAKVWNRVSNQYFCLEQGILFANSDSQTQSGLGLFFSCQNLQTLQTNTVSVPGRVPLHTQARHLHFQSKVILVSHSGTGYLYFQHFVLNRVAKFCIFSLLQGSCRYRHSAAHPHPKLGGGGGGIHEVFSLSDMNARENMPEPGSSCDRSYACFRRNYCGCSQCRAAISGTIIYPYPSCFASPTHSCGKFSLW